MMIVNYLLHPSGSAPTRSPRPHSAIAVLVVYSVLLFFVVTTYFRLLYTVTTNPGYVRRGPQWHEQSEKLAKRKVIEIGAGRLRGHDLRRTRRRGIEMNKTSHAGEAFRKPLEPGVADINDRNHSHPADFGYPLQSPTFRPIAADEASRDLQDHYTKDVFVCEGDGRPIWCSFCMNWKPDRTHHCREVDRCVRKMDHYCPW